MVDGDSGSALAGAAVPLDTALNMTSLMQQLQAACGTTPNTNFDEQGLRPPHFLCADAAALLPGCGALENDVRYDAIVTDPPYGKREWLGGRTQADALLAHADEEEWPTAFGSLTTLQERIQVLLLLGATRLVPGGRLVFWLPVHPTFSYATTDAGAGPDDPPRAAFSPQLPSHPGLDLVSVSRQALSHRFHRLLVCMERNDVQPVGDEWTAKAAAQRQQQPQQEEEEELQETAPLALRAQDNDPRGRRRWHWDSSA